MPFGFKLEYLKLIEKDLCIHIYISLIIASCIYSYIIIWIYRVAQLPDHIVNQLMLCVSHPVADIINEALAINGVLG